MQFSFDDGLFFAKHNGFILILEENSNFYAFLGDLGVYREHLLLMHSHQNYSKREIIDLENIAILMKNKNQPNKNSKSP